jgi:hypothetical protein
MKERELTPTTWSSASIARQEPQEDRGLLRPRRQGRGHDKHTVVFTFKDFNAEWDYRFGWGYYSASCPRKW